MRPTPTPNHDATAQETELISQLRLPSWYNPYTPEAIDRRRKLFEDIARNRTPESDAAMETVYRMFAEDADDSRADFE